MMVMRWEVNAYQHTNIPFTYQQIPDIKFCECKSIFRAVNHDDTGPPDPRNSNYMNYTVIFRMIVWIFLNLSHHYGMINFCSCAVIK